MEDDDGDVSDEGKEGGPAAVSRFASWKRLPGLDSYLCLDDRQTACLRARLRLDRSGLAESLVRRRSATSSACRLCKSSSSARVVEETLEHALLHCPAYAASRQVLRAHLADSIPLSCEVILGCLPPDTPAAAQLEALQASGAFLRDVMRIRDGL